MMPRWPVTVSIFAAAFLPSLTAREPVKAGGDDWEKLTAEVNAARNTALKTAIDQLDKASASPRAAQEFFLDCVKKFDFKHDLDEATKFEQWKTGFLAQWRGHDLGLVLQLQLRFQTLALRSAGAEDKALLLPAWLGYCEALVKNAHEAAYGVSFLAQPVSSSVFDKALRLHQLAGANGFGVSAIDIGGIFDAYIHPHLKPEGRRDAWQRRIELQTQFAEATMLPSEREAFAAFDVPRLLWRQFLDVRVHEGKLDVEARRAGSEFIRQHLSHPDASKWLTELKKAMDGEAGDAAAPAPASP